MQAKSIELQLLGWSESHNAGCKVTFAVHEDDLEYFKSKTERKGKIAGQIFMAALAEVNDDGQPVPHETKKPSASKYPIGLCGVSVRWAADAHFQTWVSNEWPDIWAGYDAFSNEDRAKGVICTICNVTTRKDLDTNKHAGYAFREFFLAPYAAQRKADGFVDD